MPQYNLSYDIPIDQIYQQGILPQRNQKNLFYQTTSCRSNLANFVLTSENRRILNKTGHFAYQQRSLSDFQFTTEIQKQIYGWIKSRGWDFPIASVKTIFTNHLFNKLTIWRENDQIIGYAISLDYPDFTHIAYVFYPDNYLHTNLPIRMVLQAIIDSHDQGKKYCYLGQFSKDAGYYKRNMPGFEYYNNGSWTTTL